MQEGPGATLRRARERAGVSVEEVAERLNLLVSHLEALENDDYTHFSGEVFLRGYIRGYARLLELNEAPLLRALDERRAQRSGARPPGGASAPRHPVLRFAVVLLVALLIWGLAVYLLDEREPVQEPGELPPSVGSVEDARPSLALSRPEQV
jgi:cytoskeleton protein RodZ